MMPDGSPRQVYDVINRKSFPDTDVIDVRAGDSVSLRLVNAGVTDKSTGLLGLHQASLGPMRPLRRSAAVLLPLVGPARRPT